MARNPITPITLDVPGLNDITMVAASGTGTGNGVEVAHTQSVPVCVVCVNDDSNPTTLTIVSNGAQVKGVTITNQTLVVAAGKRAYVWVPPDYFSDANKLGIDVSNATAIKFMAFKILATAFA